MTLILLLTALLTLTPDAVASRCKGEASFAIAQCGCSIVNRLSAGWSEETVLSAYYAEDVAATAEEVETVSRILNRELYCSPDLYFMYSKADTVYLGIADVTPALVVTSGGREVRFFSRWFRRR